MWMFPKIVVPPNHPLKNKVFHSFHHPFWGHFFGNTHVYIHWYTVGSGNWFIRPVIFLSFQISNIDTMGVDDGVTHRDHFYHKNEPNKYVLYIFIYQFGHWILWMMVFVNIFMTMNCACSSGWWFQPIWKKYARQNGFIFPNFRDEHNKCLLKPPSSLLYWLVHRDPYIGLW